MLSIYRKDLFQDRVVLVTGGGSGIGLRAARELALLGARVYVCGRDKEKLSGAEHAVKDRDGLELQTIVCNIRRPEEVAAMCETIVKDAGGVDLLVNNAGGQFPAPAEKISPNGWNAVIDTNLTATFGVSQAVFAQSMKAGGGAIVNVIMDMYSGFPLMAHSGAARAAVDNLTKSLAHEWAEFGVRVNAVAPGVIESSGLETYEPQFRQAVFDMGRFSMANRLGTEAEVAAGILFLLSPAASYITGETLRIDGGSSIYRPHFPPKEHDRLPPFDR
jgi:NAD(P)-dependent dehydrogenase (short-subunit alcohol dehydrogenase family)